MNNKLIALAVAASVTAGLAAPLAASAAVESKWFGYSQLTMEKHDQAAATGSKPAQDGIRFGADRIRIGYKIKDGKVFGKLQVDFNKSGQDQGGFNNIIKDAVGGYKFSNAISIKVGQFKTPVGMDFNTSGKKLDITKRGMEKKLVLERSQGIMFSGRKMGGFGYDIFYGNAAARSSAVQGATTAIGADTATAIRIMYDMGKTLHLEASTGTSSNADGSTAGTGKDYKVNDFAARYKTGPFVAKFEYIAGTDIKGTAGRDESVWFLHGGYKLNKTTELVARYYSAKADAYSGNATSDKLTNLYLGATFWMGSSKTNGRLQVNYVIAGGDTGARSGATSATTSAYNSATTKGYTDDAIIVQYQVSF